MDNTVTISFLVSLVSGIVLLFIENQKDWLGKRVSSLSKSDLLQPFETNKLEINLSKVKWIFGTLIISVPITVTIISFLYSARISTFEQQLQVYEQYSEWDLPETLISLHEISQGLELTLKEREQLSNYGAMEQQISSLQEDNEKLESQLTNFIYQSSDILIKVGDTVTLIDGHYMFGLHKLSDSATIKMDNYTYYLEIAEYYRLRDYDLGVDCKLYLMEIVDEQTAKFEFVCYE
jgi:hypothetical protein